MKLHDICILFTDGDWIESKDQSDKGIRLVQTGNVGVGKYLNKEDKAKYISDETFAKLNCTEIYPGDVLISRLPEPVGRACIIPETDERMVTAVDCTICRFDESIIDRRYAYYFLQSDAYFNQLDQNVAGTTRKRISRKNLGNVEINIPSKERQKEIICIFDALSAIIEMRKIELQDLDYLIKARFVEMFGDAVNNDRSWDVGTIDSVCNAIYGGGTPSKSHPEYYDNGNIPWVTSKDMKSDTISGSQININELGVSNSSAKLVPINSIIMVIRSGILKHSLPVAINLVPVTVNQDLKVFVTGEKIIPRFLVVLFKMLEKDILTGVRAVTADNIEFDTLKKREIILPPLELQKQFADIVEQIDKSKLSVQKSLDKLELLKKALMQKYFG